MSETSQNVNVTLSSYPSVPDLATALGLGVPPTLVILPRNFDTAKVGDELLYEGEALTIRKLWRQAGISENLLTAPEHGIATVAEKSADWVGPTVFVAGCLWGQNPQLVSIALSVVANYVTDCFKGSGGRRKVRLSIVVEKTKTRKCVRIDYEGPPNAIGQLAAKAKEIADE